jgi:hypothetical protein
MHLAACGLSEKKDFMRPVFCGRGTEFHVSCVEPDETWGTRAIPPNRACTAQPIERMAADSIQIAALARGTELPHR